MRKREWRYLRKVACHLSPEQADCLCDLLKGQIARREYVLEVLADWRNAMAQIPNIGPPDREATRPVAITKSTED